MKNVFFFFLLVFLFLNNSCESDSPKQANDSNPKIIKQDSSVTATPKKDNVKHLLGKPTKKFSLSNQLIEISGISFTKDQKHLLAINDEEGKIFYLDKNNGKIIKSIKFNKPGDYEGIELVNEKIYVVKSNGTIYEVSNIGAENQKTKKHKTFLNTAYNVEGLGYDDYKNYLLLACKGKAGKGNRFKNKRAIYAFDLNVDSLLSEPIYIIDRQEILDSLQIVANYVDKVLEVFSPEQSSIAFAPSGIAVHPQTKEIYVLSAAGKLLVILKPSGKLSKVIPLAKKLFQQPEGICFDANANLYISSEGKNKKGKLFVFD